MSQAVDRSTPSWGKAHPLPELEAAIAEINRLRVDIRLKEQQRDAARSKAMRTAHRLLEVPIAFNRSGGWNATIDALDHYCDDWRGEVVPVRRVEVAQ